MAKKKKPSKFFNFQRIVKELAQDKPNGTGTWSIDYSLDGGITFTNLRTTNAGTTYAVTTDTVNLDLRQNLAAIQVRYTNQQVLADTSGSLVANIYTPQILGSD